MRAHVRPAPSVPAVCILCFPWPQAVKQALRAAGAPRKVDAQEAARGRVDTAIVEDWGGGQPAALGDLRVQRVIAGFDAASNRPLSAQLASLLQQLEVRHTPLCAWKVECLARRGGSGDCCSTAAGRSHRLTSASTTGITPHDLQAQGVLRAASGGKPLPPFQSWAFAPRQYRQYLADMSAAHTALAAAMSSLLQHVQSAAHGGAGISEQVGTAIAALGPGSGLHRAAHLEADATAMTAAAAAAAAAAEVLAGSEGQRRAGVGSAVPPPSESATAFAEYMLQLAKTAGSAAFDAAERDAAGLRLLACAYSCLASFHSLGTRVGAAAAERSGAAAAGALTAYTAYPQLLPGTTPAAALVAAVDAAGAALSTAQKSVVYEELARAFPKAALLVAPLAAAD